MHKERQPEGGNNEAKAYEVLRQWIEAADFCGDQIKRVEMPAQRSSAINVNVGGLLESDNYFVSNKAYGGDHESQS